MKTDMFVHAGSEIWCRKFKEKNSKDSVSLEKSLVWREIVFLQFFSEVFLCQVWEKYFVWLGQMYVLYSDSLKEYVEIVGDATRHLKNAPRHLYDALRHKYDASRH